MLCSGIGKLFGRKEYFSLDLFAGEIVYIFKLALCFNYCQRVLRAAEEPFYIIMQCLKLMRFSWCGEQLSQLTIPFHIAHPKTFVHCPLLTLDLNGTYREKCSLSYCHEP